MKTIIIEGSPTSYQIDTTGQVYNTKTRKYLKGSILNGYKVVKLTLPTGKKKAFSVHRLVAQAYILNDDQLPVVNHIDRNKLNNNVDNLEWVSYSENTKHYQSFQNSAKRQCIVQVLEPINNEHGWYQYQSSSYWIQPEMAKIVNIKTNKYLNTITGKDGYVRVFLFMNNKKINCLLHRLVYEVVHGEIKRNYQINHKDGDKSNNSIKNLEEVNRKENMQHSVQILHNNVKMVGKFSLDGVLIETYYSMSEAARQNNYSIGGISLACNGKMKTYKNFIWKILTV